MRVNKIIHIDKRAGKELKKFNDSVQALFTAYVKVLAQDGLLAEPYGKKINKQLFEIRIKWKGEYRVIYAYIDRKTIIILKAFVKKTQKTPLNEIKIALNRLKEYL